MQIAFLLFTFIAAISPAFAQVDDNTKIHSIYFGGGSDWVTPDEEDRLINWLDGIDNLDQYQILIQSHTDNIGSLSYNQWLSQARSRAAFSELLDYGISAEKMDIEDFGELNPTYDNEKYQGRIRNRRVDIILRPPVT